MSMLKLISTIFTSMMLFNSMAHAQQPPKLAATTIIWKNFGPMQEGLKLIQAGVDKTNPALLKPLVSCIAHEGASYVVTEGGYYKWADIIIVDGDQAGCRGTVSTGPRNNKEKIY